MLDELAVALFNCTQINWSVDNPVSGNDTTVSAKENASAVHELPMQLFDQVMEQFGDAVTTTDAGTLCVVRDHIVEVSYFLHGDPEFDFKMLVDLTAVDWPDRNPRFDVRYNLLSLSHRRRVQIQVPVPEISPRLATVSNIWRAANWFERELHDMFGITFDGHPNLERLVLPDEFEGHPLRKEFGIHGEQSTPDSISQFEGW